MSQIRLGALLSYITILVNLVSGIIYAPWMIEKIGQSDYALFTLVNSVIAIFLFDLGLSNAVTRFTSKYLVEGNDKAIPVLLGTIFKIYLALTSLMAIVFAICFFYIENIYVNLSADEIARFKVIYIVMAFGNSLSFLFTPLEGIMTAHERFAALQFTKLLAKIATVLLIIISLIAGKGLYALVTITVLCNLAAVAYRLIYLKRMGIRIEWQGGSTGLITEVFGFSLWITIIQIAQRFYVGIIPTLLGIVSGTEAIAIFGIASTLESYGFTFAYAFINMYLPKVTRALAADEHVNRLLDLMVKVGRMQAYIIGLIVCGFLFVGQEFIDIWVGREYAAAYLCAVLLLIPLFLTHTQGIAALAVQVQNKLKWQAYAYSVCAVLNAGMALIMGKYYGAVGACLGLMIAEICKMILLDIIYYKVIKIDILLFFKRCFGNMILPFALTAVFSLFFVTKLPVSGWLWLTVKSCAICIVYLTFMWLLSMNKEEKDLIVGGILRVCFRQKEV